MARFSRRGVGFVAAGALALTLVAGGIAAAAPSDRARSDNTRAVAARPGEQPPVSAADIAAAKAGTRARAVGDVSTNAIPATAQASFGVVSSGGVLVRGLHALSATRLATGQYQVVFDHDVSAGAFIGTVGLTGSVGISPAGEIAVVGRSGLPNGVFVQTFNSAGAPANRSFHLAVLD